MTVDVTLLEEIERLKLEVESEKFKQAYAAELIQEEKKQVKTQAAQLETQQAELTQLREDLSKKNYEGDVDEATSQGENRPRNQQVAELMKANQQLKLELSQMQQSIGEVMLLAQQQASEMIETAEKKVEKTIEGAKQELLDIGFKANELNNEVKESKAQVAAVYEDLSQHLTQLAEKDFNM